MRAVPVVVAGGDVDDVAGAQVRHAFDNLEASLKEQGGGLDDLVKAVTYVVGRENLEAARRGRAAIHAEGRMTVEPAGTLLVVEGLGLEEWLVEVDRIAVLAAAETGAR